MKIKVGDGYSLKSEIIGIIQAFFNVNRKDVKVKLTNVYYSPKMTKNLLSVSSTTKLGNRVVFNTKCATIFKESNELVSVA